MPAGDQRLPKHKRLLSRAQFLALRQGSGRKHTEHFIFLWRPNGLSQSRLGLTVTRRVAGAVGRNRVRRLLREAFRLSWEEIPPGLDMVAVAKTGAPGLAFADVRREVTEGARAMKARPQPMNPPA